MCGHCADMERHETTKASVLKGLTCDMHRTNYQWMEDTNADNGPSGAAECLSAPAPVGQHPDGGKRVVAPSKPSGEGVGGRTGDRGAGRDTHPHPDAKNEIEKLKKSGSKKMGRPLGSPNKITAEIREMIMRRGRPVELLCDISRGVKIRVGAQAGPDKEMVYPDLAMRKDAAKTLLAKLVPDLRSQEIGGIPGGEPIQTAPPLDNGELARQIASMFWRADKAMPETEPVRPHSPPGAGAEALVEAPASPTNALAPATPLASEGEPSPGVDETPANGAGTFTPEPEAPDAGSLIRFLDSGMEILGCAQDRDGLPVIFELRKDDALLTRGRFPMCLSSLRKQTGDDFGPWTLLKQPKLNFAHRADEREADAWQPPAVHRTRPR